MAEQTTNKPPRGFDPVTGLVPDHPRNGRQDAFFDLRHSQTPDNSGATGAQKMAPARAETTDGHARLALSWALFGLGHAVSRLPRYPYAIYSRLMVWSRALQTGDRGPWRNVQQ